MDLAAWGVDDGWWDTSGQWREVPEDAQQAILEAMDAEGRDRPPAGPLQWFVRAGHSEFLLGPADLVLEDGTTIRNVDALPRDLPPGYHDLHPLDGGPTTRLVVTPRRCHLSPDLRAWGWAVQLYAARSQASWGMGDLGDLRRLQRWAADEGAGVVALNPLHVADAGQASPYYPSSRVFRHPIYLRVEEVDGAADCGADIDRLATLGRALNDDRRIDRPKVWALKQEALEACFARFGGDARFDEFEASQGELLHQYATYAALSDEHGPNWQAWPAELRRPPAAEIADPTRVRFHAWLQWQLDRQLAAATDVPVVQDLAVGFDPGGFDAWAWQDLLALDMRVGAPPDEFNADGQDWGLPPFVPWKLRNDCYEPFIQTVRACLRHAGGLRVDHVMGLFRLFWLPACGYVRYPAGDLLDILALESHRAGAFIVGEDLGTVEDNVRAELNDRGVLSYRLFWFEPGPPSSYPHQALAAVTTHDLPTVAGVFEGTDPQAGELRERLPEAATAADAVVATYGALAAAPSRVVLATLEDACVVTERPNMPGTVDDTNWSLALPKSIEELEDDETAHAIASALGGR